MGQEASSVPSRTFPRIAWATFGLTVAVSIALVAVPRDVEVREGDVYTRITIVEPWVFRVLYVLAGACLLGLLAICVLAVMRRAWLTAVAAFLLLGMPPVFALIGFVVNLSPWQVYDEVPGPDGARYCFLDSSFDERQLMALACAKDETVFRRTFDVLGATNARWPRSFVPIVRPEGTEKDRYGQLYLSESGMLVGIRTENHCYLAYDLPSGRFYGRNDVEALSPFILIGPTTPMSAPDLEAIHSLLVGGAPETAGPRREALEEAGKHPNPAVREAARKLIGLVKVKRP